jgi:hypothetical protein
LDEESMLRVVNTILHKHAIAQEYTIAKPRLRDPILMTKQLSQRDGGRILDKDR